MYVTLDPEGGRGLGTHSICAMLRVPKGSPPSAGTRGEESGCGAYPAAAHAGTEVERHLDAVYVMDV